MPISRTSRVAPTNSMNSSSAEESLNGQHDKSGRLHKRSRSGCFTCRLRRKKCDEGHPSCKACAGLCIKCEYKRPIWWSNAEQRRQQKERIKIKIKQTKSLERSGSLQEHMNRALSSPSFGENDLSRPERHDPSFAAHFSNPGFVPISYPQHYPYEVDVRTERQTFVNDVPLRHDSSVSTFNAMGPPQLHATLPTFPSDEWFQEEYFESSRQFSQPNTALGDPGVEQHQSSSLQANIPVNDYDRPLLDHFVDNVLRMIFPILEVHQRGSARARSVLQSLETNKSYFHCCLSVAAIHLKTTSRLSGEQIDHDIMRHRYEAISELCQALNKDADHEHILDATLAMIFFHCSVGVPDDYLPDIPWNDHFQAASNLVTKLDLTNQLIPCGPTHMVPPFSMSLTTWIDILGATMLGKTPQFAHSYRAKHLSGTPSGLRELMGCDDRIMYLISEVACLESLKMEGRIDTAAVHTHVSALIGQLEYTEDANTILVSPYSPGTGAIRPDALTKTMTAIFRIAAHIYLCSILPGADRNQTKIINLVNALTDAMAYVPSGPFGFDRSLVWPLLIAGAFSTPSSPFRQVLDDRVAALGDLADLGSMGRMYQLLGEYWRLSDDPVSPPYPSGPNELEAGYQSSEMGQDAGHSVPLSSPGMREIKRQQVHWRDVMNRNGWRYLLI
ncbi:unnamed protein product [Penicillium nalgiovense]|uniref:Zn(2)-C6 fungal-type domain-containing protein n=1 Tax=Penicillium nalgiovense TaxID=60175 RepID=A0A9W4ID13_PENNA|nr:unnamed protein product [Penicillium nalgiovense]CAG8041621.1 unnamed protein product [Penicillium nalgiovense]CAG8076897.1 unnamed protein product [Penicillium nalgiovense]CAG8092206.1 unnamed protein product [Penicillium nalgiovense]CAG8098112.1 unnamed protein product [Penicillium nalgiovense]